MKITLTFDDQRITDLLHGHSGGSSPWLRELAGKWTWKRGFRVRYDQDVDAEGAGTGHMRITASKVKAGIALMADLSPYQFGQFMSENDDDITFDTAMQCIIFGKLVYA